MEKNCVGEITIKKLKIKNKQRDTKNYGICWVTYCHWGVKYQREGWFWTNLKWGEVHEAGA